MKIAFISYEYPPDTSFGGIATYVHQAARMLHKRGHQVEIFAGSPTRSYSDTDEGIRTHRIKTETHLSFADLVGPVFAGRHKTIQFDVLEGPDYLADAREAIRLVPDIPFVLKLHTPSLTVYQISHLASPFWKKVRLYAQALRHGIKPVWGCDPTLILEYNEALKLNEIECAHALEADEVSSPSRSLGKQLTHQWNLDVAKVHYVPYPYIPVPGFLKIPADTQTNVIIFIGRLETRKGILDLAEAIPQVLRRFPKAKFCFVGPSESSPNPDLNMQQYLEQALSSFRRSIEFVGSIPTAHIPHLLAKSDICVIPSIWDNFPCVCLEAMAAARGIIATNSGGISDMISHRQLGLLVPPHQPKQLVEAIVELLESPHLRICLGLAARQRLTTEYSSERIGPLQEASYARAIARRTLLGARQQGNASGDFYA